MKPTIAEQIAAFEASRQAKNARMLEIIGAKDGETLTATEKEEFDGLELDVKEIDEHLKRLNTLKASNIERAVEVRGENADDATRTRAVADRPRVAAQAVRKLPPGIGIVRMISAMVRSQRSPGAPVDYARAADIARSLWNDTSPEIEQILRVPGDVISRSAVNPGTTTDSGFAAPLAVYQNLQAEFVEFLRPMTIIGRVPGMRMVPFKVKIPRQTAGAAVNWVGESAPKPLTSQTFDTLTVEEYKIAGIIALTEELIRFSSPSAEMLARNDLANAIVQFMDKAFVDPTASAVAGVNPASITQGVSAIVASGTTGSAFRADTRSLFAPILQANTPMGSGVWIMTQEQALAFSLMLTSLGSRQFPDITVQGGTLLGFPVVTSENIPGTGGSPTDGYPLIFAAANEILLADDGQATIDISTEASLQMETAPDSPATSSTLFISLWQQGLVGVRATRFINWLKRRTTAVGYISFAKYAE
jgi:HK97 family phage major capsid protein